MSSKKGAFVYQQVELTTVEWAADTTLYPASVWMFERLESGKFNMKLADGVHMFSELPAVMQDIHVVVKTNTADSYVLTFVSAEGATDTPNLKGQNGKDAATVAIDPDTKHMMIGGVDTGVKVEGVNGENGFTPSIAEDAGNTEKIYKLNVTNSNGVTVTPNLRGMDGEKYRIPTLEAEPDETVLSYTEEGVTAAFEIGYMARVLDEEKDEYVFWQLYDITAENKAVWKKAGSGGDMQLTEKVNITLSSNQAQPDETLSGAVIHLLYGDNDTPLTWSNSGVMSAEVPMNMTYRVVYPDLAGYATPVADEFIAMAGNTRTVSAMYNTTIMTISVDSNQTDKSDIDNLQITLSGSVSKVMTYVGTSLTLKVPTGQELTIAPAQIAGYTNMAAQKKTPVAAVDSVSFAYITEKATINVTADDGASVAGQMLTVTKVEDGAVLYTGAAGTGIILKIPFGVNYKVSVNAMSGYRDTVDQSFTTSETSRAIDVVYEKIRSNYITINQTITDPVTMISGDVNGTIIRQIRAESHRVLGKYTASGQMTICRLNDTNGDLYYDGSVAVTHGGEGDVFMRLPRFFYKAEQSGMDVWKVGFAMQALDATWKEWDGKDLIGVYEGYTTGSKVFSGAGRSSTGGVSQANWKTQARARGNGYTLVKHKHQNIIAFLFYAMYGNTNAQAICGTGTSDYQKNTGQTNPLGMADTTTANGNSMSINCWGLENWWGNKYEWVDNVVVNPASDNGLWRITEDDGSTRDVQGATASGYPKKMIIGAHLDTIVKEYGASDTTGFCDYQYTSGNGTTRVVRRSYYYASTNGGLVCADARYDSSNTVAVSGSRLAFRGDLVVAESVAAFKVIAITNG